MQNLFNKPQKIRSLILNHINIKPKISFKGKGFICALINARCHIGCSFCMFSSNMDEKKNVSNTMSSKRISRLMRLVKDSNTGYLLISGGGEGFLEPKLMHQIVEHSTADLTWMVTSGFWALKELDAKEMIDSLYKSFLKGRNKALEKSICIRVSFDSFHIEKISNKKNNLDYILHIINIFETSYKEEKNFFLQLHAIQGEEDLLKSLENKLFATRNISTSSIHKHEKKTESAIVLTLKSGYSFEITFAKQLLSNIAVDLREEDKLKKSIQIWEQDAYVNHLGKTGYLSNKNELIGNDMLVIYDGRVAGGWQCEMPDVKINIDIHSYKDILSKTLSDPGVLATIEKGLKYRFDIIDEVCKKASLRAKAVNIRDYTSPILLEENNIKVYYSLRVIQDFILEGRLSNSSIKNLPVELQTLINLKKEDLQELYNSAKYDIINQFSEEDKDFDLFLSIIDKFIKTKDAKEFIVEVNENFSFSLYKLDKWRLLFLRIEHEWYILRKKNNIYKSKAKEISELLDSKILNKKRLYDGLLGY